MFGAVAERVQEYIACFPASGPATRPSEMTAPPTMCVTLAPPALGRTPAAVVGVFLGVMFLGVVRAMGRTSAVTLVAHVVIVTAIVVMVSAMPHRAAVSHCFIFLRFVFHECLSFY